MVVSDRVSTLLLQKGNAVFSVPSTMSVYSAIETLAAKDVGALFVIDDGKLVGVISERDYARKMILQGKSPKETLVGEIMTSSPITVRSNESVEEAMRIMTDNHIRHLPVIDSAGNLAGVVSIGDLVGCIMTSQHQAIKHLEHYIAGGASH